MKPTIHLSIAVAMAAIILATMSQLVAAAPVPAPDNSGMLSGTAKWDMELVREYIKKSYAIDVATEPT